MWLGQVVVEAGEKTEDEVRACILKLNTTQTKCKDLLESLIILKWVIRMAEAVELVSRKKYSGIVDYFP